MLELETYFYELATIFTTFMGSSLVLLQCTANMKCLKTKISINYSEWTNRSTPKCLKSVTYLSSMPQKSVVRLRNTLNER